MCVAGWLNTDARMEEREKAWVISRIYGAKCKTKKVRAFFLSAADFSVEISLCCLKCGRKEGWVEKPE